MSEAPRKLIEVALPLEEINAACKADKDRKTGTIRNLHKWFAPMPLPAWRALLYAALIDDPGDDEKRAYHLDLIKRLVANGADVPDQDVVDEAQRNLEAQFPDGVPTVMDPFCGGGSTLVEAQRLGLPTFGSDLNPVPVLITRTLTQLLPKVFGQQPLHPEPLRPTQSGNNGGKRKAADEFDQLPFRAGSGIKAYSGYEGLIRDVTYYADQIRDQAWEQIGEYYPAQPGETPIAWLWARTAICPNPACGIETVLTTSWWLSKKAGELAWITPTIIDGRVQLTTSQHQSSGGPPDAPKAGRGTFACIACGGALADDYLKHQGVADRLGVRMTAVVSEVDGKRTYRDPLPSEVLAAESTAQGEVFGVPLAVDTRSMWCSLYGIDTWDKLYIPRQLMALSAFAGLVAGVKEQVLSDGGKPEWADAITSILGLAVGKLAQYGSSQSMITCPANGPTRFNSGFGRNDLPMTWDFFEQNFFGPVGGTWDQVVRTALHALQYCSRGVGEVERVDARKARLDTPGLVATDPPYFDAIGYADLSDYFYLWHRRALRDSHPDLYQTVAAPKSGELTAIPSHHGNHKETAKQYFIQGFTETFNNLKLSLASGLPMTVVYASKEQKSGAGEETRWSAILTAMIQADLEITGTWPIHGTGATRLIGMDTNAVATYVAMVCRPRPVEASACSLQDFNRELRRELKPAVERLQAAGILPVDLAQAAMGPGMQIYSRYKVILDQSGAGVPVEQALRLINQALAEVLDEQEGELDPASRFAVTLWGKHQWADVPFGEADQVARPQGISVDDVVRAHVAEFPRAGYVRLLGHDPLDRDWDPISDARPTAWEAVHHLADRLIDGGGVVDAGRLMGQMGAWRDQAQALVYRLHAIAARNGWTKDQERYNALIASWSDLLAEAGRVHESGDGLF
jgi:putative DNA methylase